MNISDGPYPAKEAVDHSCPALLRRSWDWSYDGYKVTGERMGNLQRVLSVFQAKLLGRETGWSARKTSSKTGSLSLLLAKLQQDMVCFSV